MGYSTDFKGELRFAREASAPQLAKLKAMMGEDCREHPDWNAPGLYYIDLELNDDFTGIRWNGAEKTYELEKLVNVVLKEMRKQWADFGLTGTLAAQGEEAMDRWALTIENGIAVNRKVAITGTIIECPQCEHKFVLEEAGGE